MAVVSIRIPDDTLARVDQKATQDGMTRTEYILQWLPEHYEQDTQRPTPNDAQQHSQKHRE